MRGKRPAFVCVLLLAAGCDMGGGKPDDTHGPNLHAIATFPANGDGTECGANAPDDCGVPLGTPIEIRFDRFLLPKTVSLGSVRVYSGTPANSIYLGVTYDVVERVVTMRPAFGYRLFPGILYQVELLQPPKDEGAGFQAFDGAPLVQEGSVPLRFSFRTARLPMEAPPKAPEPTCTEALDLFERAGCTACHAEDGEAPMGLRLDSGDALRATAIGHPSREVEGPDVGRVLVDPARFGLGQSRIEPGSPSRSYLMYKLLLQPENFGEGCESAHSVPVPDGTCLAASDAERERIADWFVRLDPMPLRGALPRGLSDLRLLAGFIQAGADTRSCDRPE
jgi:hypothetical protein